ncbi:hypothetical protein RR42_s1820 [Cupriavidus basilensis]|uniref:Uncharacterized protein n=1 Tax=Cupriavidus basilensis TaxID=68895 RepID=A0A0C4YJZ3_9BURK|nr:hypothetical protein RR42_s1820 [Cupriavidus basilensis]
MRKGRQGQEAHRGSCQWGCRWTFGLGVVCGMQAGFPRP